MPRYTINNPFAGSTDPNAAPIAAGINNLSKAFFGDPDVDPVKQAYQQQETVKAKLESDALQRKVGAFQNFNTAFEPDPTTGKPDSGKLAQAYLGLADAVGPEEAAKALRGRLAFDPTATDDMKANAAVAAGGKLDPNDAFSVPGQQKIVTRNMENDATKAQNEAKAKVLAERPQATAALKSMGTDLDRLAASAQEVMNSPGLGHITGIPGSLPNVPGGKGADAAAKLDMLKSQVSLSVLQNMRNNSKTGGALGNVSDAEGTRLENNLAALSTAQSLPEFKKQLQKIVDYTSTAKQRLQEAYDMTYAGSNVAMPSMPSAGGGGFTAPTVPPGMGAPAQPAAAPSAPAAGGDVSALSNEQLLQMLSGGQ